MAQSLTGTARFLDAITIEVSPALRDLARRAGGGALEQRWRDVLHGVDAGPDGPPRKAGLPLVGQALDFLANPIDVLESGYLEYGPVFSLRLGNQDVVVLIGPSANQVFFAQTDHALSIRAAYPALQRLFAPDVYFFAELERYHAQQQLLVPRFRREAMTGYVAIMEAEINRFIDQLPSQGHLEAPRDLGPLIMHIAARSFLGQDFREQMAEELFNDFRDFSGGIEAVLPLWLPLPRLRRSQEAKARLHAMFQTAIERRRSQPIDPPDFLQTLIDSARGILPGDALIRHLIMLLVWAGHETTVGHTAWALADLLEHPPAVRALRDEQTRVLGAGPLVPEQLRELKYLSWALRETERLHPVAFILVRMATEDFSIETFRVRKGTMVMVSPWVSHRLPQIFRDPHRYDPERFGPDREEGKVPYSLIGFGGGAHRCTGVNFAYQEMAIILTQLMRRLDMRIVSGTVRPIAGSQTRWPAPFTVHYRKR